MQLIDACRFSSGGVISSRSVAENKPASAERLENRFSRGVRIRPAKFIRPFFIK